MFPVVMRDGDGVVYDPTTGEVFTVLDAIEDAEFDSGEAAHCHVSLEGSGPLHPHLWMVGHRCLSGFGVTYTDPDEEEVNPFLEPDEPFA